MLQILLQDLVVLVLRFLYINLWIAQLGPSQDDIEIWMNLAVASSWDCSQAGTNRLFIEEFKWIGYWTLQTVKPFDNAYTIILESVPKTLFHKDIRTMVPVIISTNLSIRICEKESLSFLLYRNDREAFSWCLHVRFSRSEICPPPPFLVFCRVDYWL